MSDLVRQQVSEGNLWYVADQRASQLGSPGSRWALEWRWALFAKAIDLWLARRPRTGGVVRVLDAGCGDGISMSVLSTLLAERGFRSDIIGTDYNSLRLERAASDSRFRVIEADLHATPFDEASFDLVLCSHVLEHIENDQSAMRELRRIVAPEGLVILAVPNEGCLMATLRNHVFQRSILKSTDHVQFYTANTFCSRAERSGLSLMAPVMREGLFLPHLGVYSRLRETRLGRWLISAAVRLFPSQSAGLVCAFERGPSGA